MTLHFPRPLQDKVAVVTGAAGGLGLAMIDTLRAQGARVLALDLYPPGADAAPPATPGAPVIDWLRCDVADPAFVALEHAILQRVLEEGFHRGEVARVAPAPA